MGPVAWRTILAVCVLLGGAAEAPAQEAKSPPATVAPPAGSAPRAEAGPPEEVRRLHAFLGEWRGTGMVRAEAAAPVKVAVTLSCREASAGWAVLCTGESRGGGIDTRETGLVGVDRVTGKVHWFAVADHDARDMLGEWDGPHTLRLWAAWLENDQVMAEEAALNVGASGRLTYETVLTADGRMVVRREGTLKRQGD